MMATRDPIPLLPLPNDIVLFPGRKLQISATNRQDVLAIIAEHYSRAAVDRSRKKSAVIGCVPLRSPYLSNDGQQLIEAGNEGDVAEAAPRAESAGKDDVFQYGVLATISGVEGGRSGELKVSLEGGQRFKVEQITQEKPYMSARVTVFEDESEQIRPRSAASPDSHHHS